MSFGPCLLEAAQRHGGIRMELAAAGSDPNSTGSTPHTGPSGGRGSGDEQLYKESHPRAIIPKPYEGHGVSPRDSTTPQSLHPGFVPTGHKAVSHAPPSLPSALLGPSKPLRLNPQYLDGKLPLVPGTSTSPPAAPFFPARTTRTTISTSANEHDQNQSPLPGL